MTPLDLDALEAKARAATAGPWYADDCQVHQGTVEQYGFFCVADAGNLSDQRGRLRPFAESRANAAYIAAASPDTMQALIAEHRALTARVRELEAALKPFAKVGGQLTGIVCSDAERIRMSAKAGDLRAAARALRSEP
jgi:hypothetical protein